LVELLALASFQDRYANQPAKGGVLPAMGVVAASLIFTTTLKLLPPSNWLAPGATHWGQARRDTPGMHTCTHGMVPLTLSPPRATCSWDRRSTRVGISQRSAGELLIDKFTSCVNMP